MSQYDVAVIGGGPAGLSAALILARPGRDVDDGPRRTDRVPGVWAAGNVVDPRVQVITAAGAGSAAAIALNGDLVEDDVHHAVHDFEQGLPLTLTAHAHQKETS